MKLAYEDLFFLFSAPIRRDFSEIFSPTNQQLDSNLQGNTHNNTPWRKWKLSNVPVVAAHTPVLARATRTQAAHISQCTQHSYRSSSSTRSGFERSRRSGVRSELDCCPIVRSASRGRAIAAVYHFDLKFSCRDTYNNDAIRPCFSSVNRKTNVA